MSGQTSAGQQAAGMVKAVSTATAVVFLAGACFGDTGPWVVEDRLYSRSPEQWSVTCVLASLLSKPYGLRGVTREIEVSQTVEETVKQGAPCPDGRLLDTY